MAQELEDAMNCPGCGEYVMYPEVNYGFCGDCCPYCGRKNCKSPKCSEKENRDYRRGAFEEKGPFTERECHCPACEARFIGAGRKDRRWKHMIETGHVPVSWTVPVKFLAKAERFAVRSAANE